MTDPTAADLHSRLAAAVTARLDTARKATPGPWRKHVAGTGMRGRVLPYAFVTDSPANADMINPIVERHNGGTLADVDHIAANDPSRIIRDCERDLRVLDWHRREKLVYVPHWQLGIDPDQLRCRGCRDGWPCPEITDLAYAYGVDVAGGTSLLDARDTLDPVVVETDRVTAEDIASAMYVADGVFRSTNVDLDDVADGRVEAAGPPTYAATREAPLAALPPTHPKGKHTRSGTATAAG